jgi:hypothetical protein
MSSTNNQGRILTEEEKRLKMLLTPCRTKKELYRWIQYHLALSLPDKIVSRYANSSPFDFIWELYEIVVLKRNPKKISEILGVAGRGTGKTLGMAIFEFLSVLHDGRDTVHVGAIMAQAERCYNYIKSFTVNKRVKNIISPSGVSDEMRILEKSNMSKSDFNIDGNKVTLEILPCTMKSTNGPHAPLVVVDEIDTVDNEGLKAYKEINGMLDTKSGKKALRVGISTRKSRYGLMNRQIENAEKENREIRKWTLFEFTERCNDDHSGINPTIGYVLQENMETLTEKEYELKDKQKQSSYVKHTFPGEKCIKCPIASICLGDAKNQKSQSNMLKPLDEFIKKVLTSGVDWALAQLMNLQPSVEGIIYREFEEKNHVRTWSQMWKTLTGKDFPGECTHDMFVAKCHDMRLPCYAGIDWGWNAPNTVVYFFVDKRDNIFVVRCDGMTHVSQPSWVHYIKNKYHFMYRCQLYFPDSADQGAIEEMKKAGLTAANNVDKAINTGIQVIKKYLRTPGTQEPKIFLAKETTALLINEFLLYHYKLDTAGVPTEMPEDEYDHYLDAFRYPMSMLFGKSMMTMANLTEDDVEGKVKDVNGNFFRAPSAEEFAATHGIPFNPDVDKSKIGKISNNKHIENDDDGDSGTGGDGGFFWSV